MKKPHNARSKRVTAFALAAFALPISAPANDNQHLGPSCNGTTKTSVERHCRERRKHVRPALFLDARGVWRLLDLRVASAFVPSTLSTARVSAGNLRYFVRTNRAWQAIRDCIVARTNDVLSRTPFADVGVGAMEAKQRILIIENTFNNVDDTVSGASKTALPSAIE